MQHAKAPVRHGVRTGEILLSFGNNGGLGLYGNLHTVLGDGGHFTGGNDILRQLRVLRNSHRGIRRQRLNARLRFHTTGQAQQHQNKHKRDSFFHKQYPLSFFFIIPEKNVGTMTVLRTICNDQARTYCTAMQPGPPWVIKAGLRG